EDEVREQVRRLRAAGVEAVAVCLLHSYLNPEHERRIKAIVLDEFPDAYLSVSHEVLPLYREFERFSTTCLNAYVGPRVPRYVAADGQLRMRHLLDTKVGDYQAMVPMVDIDTIGAGGGSIAYVDAGGVFRVGPESAGADPGPACYGRGGTEPTSTDAQLLLGRLRPDQIGRAHV